MWGNPRDWMHNRLSKALAPTSDGTGIAEVLVRSPALGSDMA